MIDELQIILNLLGDLGHYAFWVVIVFILFKLLTLASYLALARFALLRFYRWAMKMASRGKIYKTITKYNLDNHIITHDGTAGRLRDVLLVLRGTGAYIYDRDVTWLEQAISEKKTRETN